MKYRSLAPLLACGLLVAAAPALAQGARCDRGDLDTITNAYLAAFTSGDTLKLPLADFTSYVENGDDASLATGSMSAPHRIAAQRTLYDLASCSTVVELVVTDPANPRVIATRLQFSGKDNPIAPSRLNDIESIVTKPGDWQFDAARVAQALSADRWDEIAAGARDTRQTLTGVANAYFEALSGKAAALPFAATCTRLEGGRAMASCGAGLPGSVKSAERHFVVDDARGLVAAFALLGDARLPSVHLFRIEGGKIAAVEAITACKGAACALPPPK